MNIYADRDERKAARQAAILVVIEHDSVATQNELAKVLKKQGIDATQVSLSRDIAEMGLIKVAGRYQPAPAGTGAPDPELPLKTSLKKVAPAGPHLLVLRCDSGGAQPVGLVIDKLTLPGIVGTIAGDDTVFVAVDSPAANKRLADYLQSRIKNS
jgi:transcriptional regulator of arginine metabolism